LTNASPQRLVMEKAVELKLKEEDTDSNVRKMLNSVELNLQTMKNLFSLETNRQKEDIAKRLANRKGNKKIEIPPVSSCIKSKEVQILKKIYF
jgi:hypothetical protein